MEEKQEKGVNKRKQTRFFETYISKVLKTVSSESGITSNAKQQLNSAICIIAQKLARFVSELTAISGKKTISVEEVRNSVKFIMTGTLQETVLRYAEDSVSTFENATPKHSARQNKAGIIFPPSISEKFLREFGHMLTKTTPIYFAAVLEHIVIDVLVLAVKLSQENNRVRITIRDLELAVRTDPQLNSLFQKFNLSFLGGGVVPYIHESLLNKKPRKKKKDEIEKKGHRFRPGTVSLRDIRKYQKVSNCLTFAKLPFERLVRSKLEDGMKISKDTFVVLQYYIEQYIVDILRDSNSAAIHCGRVKLLPADIDFICKLRKYSEVDSAPFRAGDQNVEDNPTENETVI
jgi:histone H3